MKKILIAATIGAAAFAAQAKDIVDTAVAAGNFGTLATALQAAGLVHRKAKARGGGLFRDQLLARTTRAESLRGTASRVGMGSV